MSCVRTFNRFMCWFIGFANLIFALFILAHDSLHHERLGYAMFPTLAIVNGVVAILWGIGLWIAWAVDSDW